MKQSAYAIALSSVLIAGCGGGSSDHTTAPAMAPATPVVVAPAPVPVVTPAPAPAPVSGTSTSASPSFADCFQVTPGTQYTTSDTYTHVVVQEMFEGVMAYGIVELRDNGARRGGPYFTLDNNVYRMLGVGQYDTSGAQNGKDVFSKEASFPLTMVAGQTVMANYTNTSTSWHLDVDKSGASRMVTNTEVETLSDELTFAGFDTITVAGRRFANACKIAFPGSVAGQVSMTWRAKGFGWIRTEEQTAQGTLVPGTRVEIVKIIAAP
ncbi:hypothetical protein [Massilia sp. CCM 8734]|uniref:hypothetical protein n=1 Tax=Massilia sp. CCM 8734 TaxID=2609283 RepID=UPI001424695C|nr:hypothetical protein [Massilia sp. CCM 8734]NIA00488.1 hypothetical protein [Massilia sp. CCM 8734]